MRVAILLPLLLVSCSFSYRFEYKSDPPLREHRAELLECSDGATCTFAIEVGFGARMLQEIRLCDVRVPAPHEPGAEAPRAWLVSHLQEREGVTLRFPLRDRCVQPNHCEKRHAGAYLAWVELNGDDVGEQLVAAGLAGLSDTKCQ